MALIELYVGAERLTMTDPQAATVVGLLRAMGRSNADSNPRRRIHWRVRLDGNAGIYQALYDEDDLSIAAFKAQLAAAFGVAIGTITHAVTTPTFGTRASTVVTFTHSSAQRFRVVLFGGVNATLEQSAAEARAYLAANAAAWGEVAA